MSSNKKPNVSIADNVELTGIFDIRRLFENFDKKPILIISNCTIRDCRFENCEYPVIFIRCDFVGACIHKGWNIECDIEKINPYLSSMDKMNNESQFSFNFYYEGFYNFVIFSNHQVVIDFISRSNKAPKKKTHLIFIDPPIGLTFPSSFQRTVLARPKPF